MKRSVITAVLLAASSGIAACGSASDKAAPATATPPVVASSAPAPAAVERPTSLYVSDAAALPACDGQAEGWLVYVKTPGAFEACLAGAWTVVDVKGPKGDAGAAGAAGAQGVAGPAGPSAAPATVTPAGLDDVWTDPDTNLKWQFVANAVTYADAQCPTGYALPTGSIPYKLVDYFLSYYAGLPSGAAYWTPTAAAGGHVTRTIDSNGSTTANAADSTAHVALCEEQP